MESRLPLPRHITGGFYEWQKVGVAGKQPYAIGMGDGGVVAMAGLWEGWKHPSKPDADWLRTPIGHCAHSQKGSG